MLSALHGAASATIARNMQDYRDMAVRLLQRPRALRRVQESLRENWLSSPLFDIRRWTLDAEVSHRLIRLFYLSGHLFMCLNDAGDVRSPGV
jgi:predicted O-linked N-acetylglucosamine transferase (SPINDLY family)